MHFPPQAYSLKGQEATQDEFEQTRPAPQAVPQAPQLLASFEVSAQKVGLAAGQAVVPVEHVSAHAPAEQTLPAAQAMPHVPQFRLSDASSTQVPEQLVEAPRHWL
jgi:hypothetical protein